MLKRVALVLAFLAVVPASALADGVELGFMGGAMGIGPGPVLTTNPVVGGIAPTFEFLRRLPVGSGPTLGGGANWGTVNFTTGLYSTSTTYAGGTLGINYFATGGSFTIVTNSAFQTVTGGMVLAGTTIFNGYFSDITTNQFLTGAYNPPPVGSPAGTGAVWYQLASCPSFLPSGTTGCSRLFSSLTGQLDPNFVAWLGLSGTTATGWVAQLDIAQNGQIFNISFGDAALYVPEPGTLALFGTGLVGIAGLVRRKLAA